MQNDVLDRAKVFRKCQGHRQGCALMVHRPALRAHSGLSRIVQFYVLIRNTNLNTKNWQDVVFLWNQRKNWQGTSQDLPTKFASLITLTEIGDFKSLLLAFLLPRTSTFNSITVYRGKDPYTILQPNQKQWRVYVAFVTNSKTCWTPPTYNST